MRQSYRFGSVRFGSVRFGSVRQEHSALFSVCQVISHKNFRKFIAEDRVNCALPSAFFSVDPDRDNTMLTHRKSDVPFSRHCVATENDVRLESGDALW